MKLHSARFHSNSYKDQQKQYQVSYKLVHIVAWKLADIGVVDDLYTFFDRTTKGVTQVSKTKAYLEKQKNLMQNIAICEEIPSHLLSVCQMADFFTGCMAYKLNVGQAEKCREHIRKNQIINWLESMDQGFPLDLQSTNPYGRWNYYERKFQHYNLHLRSEKISRYISNRPQSFSR